MAPGPLTVRNITAIPLELRMVESFESSQTTLQKSEGFFSNITSMMSNTTMSPKLRNSPAEGQWPLLKKDLNIRIPPFQTKKTDVHVPSGKEGKSLRLELEVERDRYRIDIEPDTQASHPLSPLAQHPKFNLTGVYTPRANQLTIYSSASLSSWMSHLPASTPLSALSIPGTHNSPTYHRALPSVRCQAVDPLAQLNNGIRFFDVRVQPGAPPGKELTLVHGVFPISLTGPKYLHGLLETIYSFLAAHPSETLILCLKREGTGSSTDQDLARSLHDHYANHPDHRNQWYTSPAIPTLSAARGKIVLMRRFGLPDELRRLNDGAGWGIDAECWAENTPNDTHGSVCVQDFYQVTEAENVGQKLRYVEAHLQRAAECVCHVPGVNTDKENPVPPGPFYLNFLSASNFWRVGCWPDRIAAVLNPRVVEGLCERHGVEGDGGDGKVGGDGQTGIVVCDWVGVEGEEEGGDWGLVRCVVGMNARLIGGAEMSEEKPNSGETEKMGQQQRDMQHGKNDEQKKIGEQQNRQQKQNREKRNREHQNRAQRNEQPQTRGQQQNREQQHREQQN